MLVLARCFLLTVPQLEGWQLILITITVFRSIQALAVTFPAWTVTDSPLLNSKLCVTNKCISVFVVFLSPHTHTHTHARTHARTYTHIHTCTHIHMHTYTHTYICTYVYTHTHPICVGGTTIRTVTEISSEVSEVSKFLWWCVCVQLFIPLLIMHTHSIHVRIHTLTHTYTYIHTHTHTHIQIHVYRRIP